MPRRKKQSLYSKELGPEDIGALLRAIDEHKGRWTTPVSLALQLAPYCAVRPSELLQAVWDEINLDTAEWLIPAQRMKMKQAHLVPLPRQAVALLRKMREFSGERGRRVSVYFFARRGQNGQQHGADSGPAAHGL